MNTVDVVRAAMASAGLTPGGANVLDVRTAVRRLPRSLGITLPPGFDDSDDHDAIVDLLTADERASLGLPPASQPEIAIPATLTPKPFKIRMHLVLCGNDDGSGEHATLEAMASFYETKLLPLMNKVFESTELEFVFDRNSDAEFRSCTLYNQDFVAPTNLDLKKQPGDPPLSGDQIAELSAAHEQARHIVAKQYEYRGRLVHFCVDGTSLEYDKSKAEWVIIRRNGGYGAAEYVHVPSWLAGDAAGHANFLAHEMGHYLGLPHTFSEWVKDRIKLTFEQEATFTEEQRLKELQRIQSTIVKEYLDAGHPPTDALKVFDGDGLDTEEDDAGAVIQALNRINGSNECGPIGECEIFVEGQAQPFVLTPDRGNVMSYFKHCTNIAQHFSPGQAAVMKGRVDGGERRRLLGRRGTPTAASWPGVVHLFGLGQNHHVWHKGISIVGNSDWADIGGPFVTHPVPVSWAMNRVDIFAIASDGQMSHKVWDFNQPGSPWYPSGTAWQPLGGNFHRLIGTPAAASWAPDRLDIFAVGAGGGMFHKAWDAGSWYPSETGWHAVGGQFISSPAVCSWGPDRLDIFALGLGGGMFHKAWDAGSWYPSETGWHALGGQFIGPPAVCSWGTDRLDIVGFGLGGGVFHKAWEAGTWSPSETGWQDLGGTFICPPTVGSWGSNRLDIFGISLSGEMLHKAWESGTWSPGEKEWTNIGAGAHQFTCRPSVVTDAKPENLHVVGIDLGGQLYRKTLDPDGWYPKDKAWIPEGGVFI